MMASVSRRIEWTITGVLTLTVAVLAAVVVHRELRNSSHGPPPPGAPSAPEYVADWRTLVGRGIQLGDSGAPLHVIEFVDFQCPNCAQQHTAIERARARFGDRLSLTFVHLPISSIHPFAHSAAEAAECAHAAGGFERFANVLFARQDSLGLRPWETYRREAAIGDSATFASCLSGPAPARVAEGLQLAASHNVGATPTTLINGWRYVGALSDSVLDDVLTRLIEGRLPAGVGDLVGAHASGATVTSRQGYSEIRYDSAALDRATRLSISPVPVRVLGRDEAEAVDLSSVTDAAILDDGHIVTFSPFRAQLLAFGPDGRLVRTIGQKGRGPREFRAPSNFSRIPGDTLVLMDAANGRVFWATPGGGVVRERSVRQEVPVGLTLVAGILPEHKLVLREGNRFPTAVTSTQPVRSAVAIAVLPETGPATQLMTVEGGAFRAIESRYQGQRRPEMDYVRFSGLPHVAVWDSAIATAAGDRYRINLHSARGDVVAVIEVQQRRRAVTSAIRRSTIEQELERLFAQTSERMRDSRESERLVREMPFSDSLAPIQGMYVSTDNLLWVVDAIAPGDVEWSATAFRLDGSVVGRLHVDGTATPIAFAKDRVLLRETRNDGVVLLREHRIVASPPQQRP